MAEAEEASTRGYFWGLSSTARQSICVLPPRYSPTPALGTTAVGRRVSLVGLGLRGGRRRGPELLDPVGKRHPVFVVNIDGLVVVGGNGLFVRASRQPSNYCNHGDIRVLDVIFRKARLLRAPPAPDAMEV
ncbi:hypothetical protein ACQJBY_003286 [Aegilops geniculata]